MNFSNQTLIWIALGYIVICAVVYFIQKRFIFKPEKLSQDFVFNYEDLFEELFFEPEPNVKINALRFYQDEPARGLLIYFHGNTRSIKGWSKYATDFSRSGYDVLMIDYRGFGKSVGTQTEEGIKKDSQYVYNKMRSKYGYAEDRIVIYGRSLGSGFATKLASNNHPKMLILDAPYYSFTSIFARFLPFLSVKYLIKFSIRTDVWIKFVKCPIYIIHGTKDRLIPFRSSVKLRNLVPQTARLIPIYGGGHNNLPNFKEYHQHLDDILNDRFDLIFDKYERRFD